MRKSPVEESLESLTRRNIETISRIEQATHDSRTRADVVADTIARFCGSMAFVWVHCLWYGSWLLFNMVAPKAERFDPAPFPNLTLIVSLEAIFLSTFILISQNRQQRLAEKRNHLDLQINLLAEQENSQVICMLQEVMQHMGIKSSQPTVEALQKATDPEKLSEQIDEVLEISNERERQGTN